MAGARGFPHAGKPYKLSSQNQWPPLAPAVTKENNSVIVAPPFRPKMITANSMKEVTNSRTALIDLFEYIATLRCDIVLYSLAHKNRNVGHSTGVGETPVSSVVKLCVRPEDLISAHKSYSIVDLSQKLA